MGDARLVAKGVTAAPIDGAEHRFGIVGVHERAGSIVDGFAGDGAVVGVHHAVDEADQQPARDQMCLPRDDGGEQGGIGLLRRRRRGVVAGDDVVGEQANGVLIVAGGEILEGADADMARRHARQHRAGLHGLADHDLAGGDGRQRPRGRNAQCCHRLADDVFAQYGAECGAPVATAREGGAPRAFQLDVAPDAVAADHLAEQHRAAVAELRGEVAELMAGIGAGEGGGAGGHGVAREDRRRLVVRKRRDVDTKLRGQHCVEFDEPGGGDLRG